MAVTKISALASRARDFQDAPAFQLLAVPNFRRLVGGVALGMVAFNINLMAQSWLVLDMTDSTLWVGVVAGASTVTVMVFSLVAGGPGRPDGPQAPHSHIPNLPGRVRCKDIISPSTVSHHVTSILTKTDSTNRVEAATYASRHGLT